MLNRFNPTILNATGSGGSVGPPGAPGDPGASAYEIAVQNGFVGNVSQWLESLIGSDGQDATLPVTGFKNNSDLLYSISDPIGVAGTYNATYTIHNGVIALAGSIIATILFDDPPQSGFIFSVRINLPENSNYSEISESNIVGCAYADIENEFDVLIKLLKIQNDTQGRPLFFFGVGQNNINNLSEYTLRLGFNVKVKVATEP